MMTPPPEPPIPSDRGVIDGDAGSTATDPFATALSSEASTPDGRFRIIRELNKGNLGVVYVAIDCELNRDIALKHIREDRLHSRSAREHFMREAEVTGKLEHPGIVPVYSLNTDCQDRLYYAMRLIRGIDLRTAISLFHQAVADERIAYDGPELRELIRNLISVCHTMAYAHSRGVLHRDLKPANIMLGPFGETLVVDWGLAKATGQGSGSVQLENPSVHEISTAEMPLRTSGSNTLATEDGSIIGTPAYAPPEQLNGRIDAIDNRSDVYSLGVMLFEILTGALPTKSKSIPEMIAEINADVLPEPCSILKSVPRPISAICRRAMRPKPEDRYQDVQQFRSEIENWLNDQPVLAYEENLVERVYRWMRTHQSYVRGAIGSLLVATCVSILAAYFINAARQTQAVALRNEAQARKEATELYQLARTTTESLLLITNDRLKEIPDATDVRQALLLKAAQSYEKMANNHTNDADLQREAAAAQMGLAAVQRKLGQTHAAIENLNRAVSVLEQLAASTVAIQADSFALAAALVELSRVSTDLPREDPLRRQALPTVVRALSVLEGASSTSPRPSPYWLLRGQALIQQAIIKQDDHDTLAAVEANRSAIQSLRSGIESAVKENVEIELRHQLARALLNLGICLSEREPDNAEVQSCYEQAIENLQWCIERDPSNSGIHYDLGLVQTVLGDLLLLDKGDRRSAQSFYVKSRDFFAGLTKKHPLVLEYKQCQISALLGLGYLAYRNDKPQEAEAQYREACQVADQLMLQNSARIGFRRTAALAKFHLGELLTYEQPAVALSLLNSASELLLTPSAGREDVFATERARIDSQAEIVKVKLAHQQLNMSQVDGLSDRLKIFINETEQFRGWRAAYNSACYISLACQALADTQAPADTIAQAAQVAIVRLKTVLQDDRHHWTSMEQDPDLQFLHRQFPAEMAGLKPN